MQQIKLYTGNMVHTCFTICAPVYTPTYCLASSRVSSDEPPSTLDTKTTVICPRRAGKLHKARWGLRRAGTARHTRAWLPRAELAALQALTSGWPVNWILLEYEKTNIEQMIIWILDQKSIFDERTQATTSTEAVRFC